MALFWFFFLRNNTSQLKQKQNTSAKYHSSQHYDQYQAQHLTSCKSRLYFGHILHVDTVQYNQSSCKLESMILSCQLWRHGHNFFSLNFPFLILTFTMLNKGIFNDQTKI